MDATSSTLAVKQSSSTTKPLAFMDVLNPTVSYAGPGADTVSNNDQNPRLIVLLAWMNARDAHISKYITQYHSLFPSSCILLVRCTAALWMRPALRRQRLKVALPILRDLATTAGVENQEPQFLVHIFSNGGAASARTLWDLWASDLGGDKFIPRYVVIMDSCPGLWTYKRDYHVAASSLPGWAWLLAHVFMVMSWLLWISWGRRGPHEINAENLNASGFTSREERRTYMYGTEDKAVGCDHVEAHGEEARKKGVMVRMEKFQGGEHVSLVRVDADRYWGIVKETWSGGG